MSFFWHHRCKYHLQLSDCRQVKDFLFWKIFVCLLRKWLSGRLCIDIWNVWWIVLTFNITYVANEIKGFLSNSYRWLQCIEKGNLCGQFIKSIQSVNFVVCWLTAVLHVVLFEFLCSLTDLKLKSIPWRFYLAAWHM